jgi:hypothetical protein
MIERRPYNATWFFGRSILMLLLAFTCYTFLVDAKRIASKKVASEKPKFPQLILQPKKQTIITGEEAEKYEIKLHSSVDFAIFQAGLEAYERNHFQYATKLFTKVYRDFPASEFALRSEMNCGIIAAAQGKWTDAIDILSATLPPKLLEETDIAFSDDQVSAKWREAANLLSICEEENKNYNRALQWHAVRYKKFPEDYFCGTCRGEGNGHYVLRKLKLWIACQRDEECYQLAAKVIRNEFGYRVDIRPSEYVPMLGRLYYEQNKLAELQQLYTESFDHQLSKLAEKQAVYLKKDPNFDSKRFGAEQQRLITNRYQADLLFVQLLTNLEQSKWEEVWKVAILEEEQSPDFPEISVKLAKEAFRANPNVTIPFLMKKLVGMEHEQVLAFEILSRLKAPDLFPHIEAGFELLEEVYLTHKQAQSESSDSRKKRYDLAWQLFMSLRRLNTPQAYALYLKHKNNPAVHDAERYVDSNAHVVLAGESPTFEFRLFR